MGAFPPEAADIRPTVVFRDCLFSGEELADTVVSVRGDVPMSPVQQLTDMGVATVQITFIFIDFRVCDFAFAFKTRNAGCLLFIDRFQFAF